MAKANISEVVIPTTPDTRFGGNRDKHSHDRAECRRMNRNIAPVIEADPLGDDAVKARPGFRDLAIREFNHRVANTLCLLSVGLRQDFIHVTSPELKAALRRHERQIISIAELHRLLGADAGSEKCAIAAHFQPLCNALACAVLAPLNVRCEAFLADETLRAEQCTKLALIISELVINAAKHAFPANKAGSVRIEIVHEGGICRCTVSDDGIGLGSGPAGCGSGIVSVLVAELAGRIFVQSGKWGTAISVMFPA